MLRADYCYMLLVMKIMLIYICGMIALMPRIVDYMLCLCLLGVVQFFY